MQGIFPVLGWSVSPSKTMDAYAILLFWSLAVLMAVLALTVAAKPTDATKQKSFNYYTVWSLVGLLFALFFAIRTVS